MKLSFFSILLVGIFMVASTDAHAGKCMQLKNLKSTFNQIEKCLKKSCKKRRFDSLFRRMNNNIKRAARSNRCSKTDVAAARKRVASLKIKRNSIKAPPPKKRGFKVAPSRRGGLKKPGSGDGVDPRAYFKVVALANKQWMPFQNRLTSIPTFGFLKMASLNQSTSNLGTALRAWEGISKLGPFIADCKGKYKKIIAGIPLCKAKKFTTGSYGYIYKIAKWCKWVSNAKSMLKPLMIKSTMTYVKAWETKSLATIASLKKGEWITGTEWLFFKHFNKNFKTISSWVTGFSKKIGVAPPKDWDKKLKNNNKVYFELIKKDAKKRKLRKNAWKKRKLQRSFKKMLKKEKLEGVSIKVRKVVLIQNSWTIIRTAIGIPTQRWLYARAIVKLKGEKLCRIYQGTVIQSYLGGGRFENPGGANVNKELFLFIKCR